MSDIQQDLYAGLKATITTAWPEIVDGLASVAGSIHRSTSINRANWENLINNTQLVAPYVVIEFGKEEQEDWAMDAMTFRVPTSVYYIFDINDTHAAISGGFDPEGYCRSKLLLLREKMFLNNNVKYQLAGSHPMMDTSETNPANIVFYQLGCKKFGGLLSASLLISEY